MAEQPDVVIVMQGPHGELERVAARLTAAGVDSEIVRPEAGSGSS